jgi:uncharacterized membrane protein HdeD (DUF308 family)
MRSSDLIAQSKLGDQVSDTIARHWQLFLIQGLVLEALGVLAFAMPVWSTLAIDILIGWLLFGGGLVRTVMLVRAKHVTGYWPSLAASVLTMILGAAIALHPFGGMLTLTMMLIVLFAAEGVAAVIGAFDFRQHTGHWLWLLISGLIDFYLVFLLWSGWPATAAWAIGAIAGVYFVMFGLALVTLSFAARKTLPRS